MNIATKQENWTTFLNFYAGQNSGRLTRLGVFENQSGVINDYWIESGLPLSGIDTDSRSDVAKIGLMLGDDFMHIIENVRNIKVNFSFDGNGDGLDITNADGKTTILRFEN